MKKKIISSKLKNYQLIIGLIVASFIFSPEIFGAEVTKRVIFPKGKKSISYKGKLPREYASYDSYILRAKKRTNDHR